jgi:Flp pilus assembly protein TadG
MKNTILNERGQALILIALAAVGLVGIVGLAIDGSAKFSDQRHAQNAADTVAMAAALAKVTALENGESNSPLQCPPTSGTPSDVCTALQTAGYARATSNGYDGNLVTNTVKIYSPPISGPYAGSENYVQVFITSYVKTTFSRVVGIEQSQNIVQATSYLYEGGNLAQGAMLISYDPNPSCNSGGASGGGSVDVSGTSHVYLNGGGIFLNSQVACGFAGNCPDLNITGGSINSAATMDNIDQNGCSVQAPESIGQDPVSIPDEIFWPKVPPQCSFAAPAPTLLGTDPLDGKGEWLIYPGFYTDFPQANLVSNKQHIYMASGVYCIDPPMNQDLSWSPVSFVSLNGSTALSKNKYAAYNPKGVTLYVKAGGGYAINANNPTFLDATKDVSSEYQGYLIILEGNHTSIKTCSITGGANIVLNGMIFSPYCKITINGGSSTTATINAQLLGWDLNVTGTNTINFNYDPSNQVKIKSKIGLVR